MYPLRRPSMPMSPSGTSVDSRASSFSSPDSRAPPNAFHDSAASAAPVAAAPPLSSYKEPTAPQSSQPQPQQQLQQQSKPAPLPQEKPHQPSEMKPAVVSEQQSQSDGRAPVPKWAGSGFRIKKAVPVALPPQRSSERGAAAPGPPSSNGGGPLTQKLRAAIDQDQQQRSNVPPASPRLAMASQSIKQVGGRRAI